MSRNAPLRRIFGLPLYCQIAGLANAAWVTFRWRPGETIFAALGAVVLAAYQLANLAVDLAQEAVPIRHHWPQILQSASAMALLAGVPAGTRLTSLVRKLANAPWLAVLPWSPEERQRAIRRGAVWLAAPFAIGIFLFVWIAARATHAPHALLSAFAPMCAFATSCLAATGWCLRSAAIAETDLSRPPLGHATGHVPRLLSWLDRQTPRWAGSWALGDAANHLGLWWIISLVLGGGTAACISLAQNQPWPSLVMGVLGGHMMFLVTLHAGPLLSPVLRSAPLRFAAAWAAMLRLPLSLSFAWLLCATPPALAAQDSAWRAVPGYAIGLLLLNAFFAAALATVPGSRRQALVLHAIGTGLMLQQTLEYGLAYGVFSAVLIFAIAILLVHQARRRFRTNG